jgi:hypothetical protein
MIAFGCAVTRPGVFEACARPGIERAREEGSLVLEHREGGSIFQAYNALLDRVRDRDDLEALVLLHQDTEVVSDDLCARVREAFADPTVGLAGCAGAVGVRSLPWWEGTVTWAAFTHRHDRGDLASSSWNPDDLAPYARLGEVEALDGFLLVLTPWAVRELRFDEGLGALHGYDTDLCLQVREAGRRVVTIDVRAIHHHELAPFGDTEEWVQAHVALAEKWAGRMPPFGDGTGTWRERALLAEARRDAVRAQARTAALQADARARQIEAALAEAQASTSWRLTAPLRRP